MLDVLPLIETRWQSILDGKLFEDPTGVDREMRIIRMGLQSKRISAAMGHDYPFLTNFVLSGADNAGGSSFFVQLIAGVYIAPDRDDDGDVDSNDDIVTTATTVMEYLVNAFRQLANNANYSPYSLEKIKWQIGDEKGDHPGPDNFVVAALLEFSQAPIL